MDLQPDCPENLRQPSGGWPRSASARRRWHARPENSAVQKSEEWVTMGEAATILGIWRYQAGFVDCWNELIAAVNSGRQPEIDGDPVEFAACRIAGVDRWCISRRHVMLLAEPSTPTRVCPRQPSGWLRMEEALSVLTEKDDPQVFEDAWRALTKKTAFEGMSRISGLGTRFLRHPVSSTTNRWLIAEADVIPLAKAVRGRLPHLRKGYMPPDQVLARVDPECRKLAAQLLRHLTDVGAQRGSARLNGKTVDLRPFLIGGRRVMCLAEDSYGEFVRALREMYDAQLAEEVARASNEDCWREDADDDVGFRF